VWSTPPDNAAAGAGEGKIKLYPDADSRVGRIEVFNLQGGRLGALTQGSTAFAIRQGPGGRFAAVPFQIPPQEAARDRGVVQRLFASHTIGRQMAIQRRQLRGPVRQGPNRRPNNQRRNNPRQPGGPLQPNRGPNLQQKGTQERRSAADFKRNYGSSIRLHARKTNQYDRRVRRCTGRVLIRSTRPAAFDSSAPTN
jgi:hypothetical protein